MENTINLSTEQQEAIDICADGDSKIVCVTGQAGTGKTTILRNVYNALSKVYHDEEDIVLAAPTGRAAKRIEEATGIAAMTIHRMLRYTTPTDEKEQGLPRHDAFNPMPHYVILIDEASMIDETLWRGLIAAMRRGAIIRFFGDVNQLPPVANNSKSPFNNALSKFPTTILTENYRSEDGIIAVSDKIIKGRIPIANEQVQIFRIKSTETMYSVRDLCEQVDFTTMDAQVITPTQKTKYGCDAISTFIQQRYNPETEKILIYQKDKFSGDVITRTFKRGDKVLWTKNDYNLGIMNGTLGIVQDFDLESGEMIVSFDNADIVIPASMENFNPTTGERFRYDPRNSLMLGYAITTHKSQGSQFDTVLHVVTNSRAATRQNLYTAVTRAKNKLIILNVAGALARALNTKTDI